MDRRPESVISIAEMYFEQLQHSQASSGLHQQQGRSDRSDSLLRTVSDKLRTIGGAIAEGRDLEDITAAVLRQIAIDNSSDHGRSPSRAPSSGDATARSANDSNSKDGDYNDTRGNNTGTTAIFVYSMSEVILIVGVAKAMQFIRTLKASASMALNSNNNSRSGLSSSSGSSSSRGGEYKSEDEAKLHEMSNGDLTTKLVDPQSRGADGKPVDSNSNSNSNSSSSLTVSIVALVHSSLHSAHTLSRLLPQPQPSHPSLLSSGSGSPFNASVIVKPNDGSLSAQIVCEMQVVRVSSLTGKVVEASNFFTAKAGQSLLVPIIKMKIKKEEPVAVTQSAVTSSNFSVTKEEQERARTAASLGVKALSIAPVHDNRRLITFDSADPEFDEDSDPDADLDL